MRAMYLCALNKEHANLPAPLFNIQLPKCWVLRLLFKVSTLRLLQPLQGPGFNAFTTAKLQEGPQLHMFQLLVPRLRTGLGRMYWVTGPGALEKLI